MRIISVLIKSFLKIFMQRGVTDNLFFIDFLFIVLLVWSIIDHVGRLRCSI